jgi:hypothetical protein
LKRFYSEGAAVKAGRMDDPLPQKTPSRTSADIRWQPTNVCLDSFVLAEFFRKTGKATFANSA